MTGKSNWSLTLYLIIVVTKHQLRNLLPDSAEGAAVGKIRLMSNHNFLSVIWVNKATSVIHLKINPWIFPPLNSELFQLSSGEPYNKSDFNIMKTWQVGLQGSFKILQWIRYVTRGFANPKWRFMSSTCNVPKNRREARSVGGNNV